MTFKKAVEAAQHPVNGAYRPGKQAMEGRRRRLVTCADSTRLTGSIDLDTALRQHRPDDQPGLRSRLQTGGRERTGDLGRSSFSDNEGSLDGSQETAVAEGLVERERRATPATV